MTTTTPQFPPQPGTVVFSPGLTARLKRVALFSGLTDEELAPLVQRCRRRTFPPNTALIHQGDPGETLYLLLAGRVAVQRVAPSGEAVHVADCGPDEYFGELSLLDGKPRSADVVTTETADVLMLDRAAFQECLAGSPRMAAGILEVLAARLRHANDQTTSHITQDVTGRLASYLLSALPANAAPETGGLIRLETVHKQREIAQRIGTSRETVNRALARLKQSGVLREKDGHLLVHRARLRALAEH